MALKILLADDSMTAQNMGKKILADAGYVVVAVSNGAQAVKKIASEKPDLAVLDVFMPGYTGLEVCERVKKAQETAHIPVLLTVGKMEPFKAEEGTRAGADGLIVKPFEASDLLAAVKKMEQKLAAPAAAEVADETVKIPVPVVEEFQDASYEEWKVSSPETPAEEEAPAPEGVSVPHEMASSPAFGMEDMVEAPAPPPAAPVVAEADTQPIEVPVARSTAAIEVPAARSTVSMETPKVEVAPKARTTAEMPAPLQAAAGAAAAQVEEVVPAPPEDNLAMTSSFKSMLSSPEPAEIEFNASAAHIEIEHAPAPGFEPTVSQEQHAVGTGRDPALVTDTDELSQFATKFGVQNAEAIPVGVASEMPELYADSQAPPAEAPPAEDDFEARVAAAMAGYEEPRTDVYEAPAAAIVAPELPASIAPEPEPAPVAAAPEPAPVAPEPAPAPAVEPEPAPAPVAEVGQDTASMLAQMQEAVEAMPVDTTPHVEEPVAEAPPAPPPPAEPVAVNAPDHALAAAMAAAVGAAAEPQVVAAVTPPMDATVTIDPTMIAEIVHRVVERMKPDLAAEIAKELESKMKK